MTQVSSRTSADWDQQSFDACDRRGARRARAAGPEKQHDLLHLAFDPTRKQQVHELVHQHSRHTDSVHTHDDALVVHCAPGDAAGLRARLELVLAGAELPVAMNHGTFTAGSELTHNVASLREL